MDEAGDIILEDLEGLLREINGIHMKWFRSAASDSL